MSWDISPSNDQDSKMDNKFLAKNQSLIEQASTCSGDTQSFFDLIDQFYWNLRYERFVDQKVLPEDYDFLFRFDYAYAKTKEWYPLVIESISEFSRRLLANHFCPTSLLFDLKMFRVYWHVICSNEVFALYVQENESLCDGVLYQWFANYGYEKFTHQDAQLYQRWSILSEVIQDVPVYDPRVVEWLNGNLEMIGSKERVSPLGDQAYHPKTGKVYQRALSRWKKSFAPDYVVMTTRDIVYATNQIIADDIGGKSPKYEIWGRYFFNLVSLLREEKIRGKFILIERVNELARSIGKPCPIHPLSLLTEDGTYLPISSELKPFDKSIL